MRPVVYTAQANCHHWRTWVQRRDTRATVKIQWDEGIIQHSTE